LGWGAEVFAGGPTALLPPVLAFLGNVTAQIILLRLAPGRRLLRSVVIACGIGGGILLAGEWAIRGEGTGTPPDRLALAAANLLIYGCLSYCYFHFINLGETARRIRILREIRLAGGVIAPNDLQRRYNAREMLDRRVARLLGTGQLVLADGRFRVGKPLMRAIAATLVGLKLLFLGRGSEFDSKEGPGS
jgi:hypothetical protein